MTLANSSFAQLLDVLRWKTFIWYKLEKPRLQSSASGAVLLSSVDLSSFPPKIIVVNNTLIRQLELRIYSLYHFTNRRMIDHGYWIAPNIFTTLHSHCRCSTLHFFYWGICATFLFSVVRTAESESVAWKFLFSTVFAFFEYISWCSVWAYSSVDAKSYCFNFTQKCSSTLLCFRVQSVAYRLVSFFAVLKQFNMWLSSNQWAN